MEKFEKSVIRYLRRLEDAGVSDLPRPDVELVEKMNAWLASAEQFADANPADSEYVCESATAKEEAAAVIEPAGQLFLDGEKTANENSYEGKVENKADALAIVETEVSRCTKCVELASKRTQTVFGVGNPNAGLCFLGEGPGADEDRLGEPFVGKAGQLLDRIIEACQMKREDVYILNTVKCRPPGNRNPAEDELDNCWNYAYRQLEIIQPEFIVCLGSVAATTLLKTKQSISRMRQQFHRYRGSRVIVTYHPAYLLRNPSAKRQVWDDMKMLLNEMGIELPNRSGGRT